MWCADPFLECLKASGYSVVRSPRADLAPLQLLLRNGRDLEQLGAIDAVFTAGLQAPVPEVSCDRPALAISGHRTGTLDAGTGLTLLATLLAALAGGPVAIEAAFRCARRLAFTFEEVLEDAVSIVDLDAYLAGARVTARAGCVAQLLDADDLYVTTAVVKSRGFTLDVAGDDGADVKVDVPLLQHLVGGRVSVSRSATSSARVTYRGRLPLGFGFRAVRLFYEDGRYSAFRPHPWGTAALRAAGPTPDWLSPSQGFARIATLD